MDITRDIKDQECEACGTGRTDAADGDGRRLCATDAASLQKRGALGIEWDDDAPQDAALTLAKCGYCGTEVRLDTEDGYWVRAARPPSAPENLPWVCAKSPNHCHDPEYLDEPALP